MQHREHTVFKRVETQVAEMRDPRDAADFLSTVGTFHPCLPSAFPYT
jgi:ribosomal protein S16